MGCVLRKINSLKDFRKCVICSCSLGECSDKIKLICGHTFHKKCIRDWFLTAKNCPLCRKNIWQLVLIYFNVINCAFIVTYCMFRSTSAQFWSIFGSEARMKQTNSFRLTSGSLPVYYESLPVDFRSDHKE